MAKVRMLSLGLIVVAAVVWAVWPWYMATDCYGESASPESVGSPLSATSVESQSTAPLLAARYHLRNRTNNFFKRSTRSSKGRRSLFSKRADNMELAPEQLVTEQLAARYHLRNRTNDFFKRSTTKRTGKVQAMPKQLVTEQLAARYHLRTRTNDFFGRTITRGCVS